MCVRRVGTASEPEKRIASSCSNIEKWKCQNLTLTLVSLPGRCCGEIRSSLSSSVSSFSVPHFASVYGLPPLALRFKSLSKKSRSLEESTSADGTPVLCRGEKAVVLHRCWRAWEQPWNINCSIYEQMFGGHGNVRESFSCGTRVLMWGEDGKTELQIGQADRGCLAEGGFTKQSNHAIWKHGQEFPKVRPKAFNERPPVSVMSNLIILQQAVTDLD